MTPYYKDESVTIFNASCLDALPCLADCSVDSVVTDPPAGISFMGKDWDHNKGGRDSWIAWMSEIAAECLRILKPGGHALVWAIPRTSHWTATAWENAGFEVRDRVSHLFGSGFPKSLDISKALDAAVGSEREVVGRYELPDVADGRRAKSWGLTEAARVRSDRSVLNVPSEREMNITAPATEAAKQWDGWGTALKPACEDWWLLRKPLIGTVVQNILEHGTGGLNVDGCRIDSAGEQIGAGSKSFVAWRRTEGRSDLPVQPIASRPDALGRWPANVIHDGSDEVLAAFPDAPGQQRVVTGLEESLPGKNVYMGGYGRSPSSEPRNDFGSAARFFYCAKASKEDREENLGDLPIRSAGEVTDRTDGSDGLNSPRAGAGRTNGSRNGHPTVKPTDLMRYLVRLVTPPNGTVLDPFAGSGSTGKACAHEGFNAILIEKELEYCEIAKRRARLAQGKFRFEATA